MFQQVAIETIRIVIIQLKIETLNIKLKKFRQ